MYDHRLTPTYVDCVQRYHNRTDVQAALARALTELAVRPFGNPKLQTHAVKKAAPGTFTSYVTNQGHRVIWRLVGNVIVFLLFGEHDAVYRRAERLRLEIDDSQNVLRVIDEDPGTGAHVPYAKRRADEGTLFMAWNDAELSNFGFTAQEVTVLRRLNSDEELLELDGRMRPDTWQLAMNLTLYGSPDGRPPQVSDTPTLEAAPAEPIDEEISQALIDSVRSPEFVHVPADRLAEVLSRPIEDWMIYLDDQQRGLVDREFTGPARIRGAAGTGKTVVALHRALRLARSGKRVLFTTYVRTLPDVYRHLFARLAGAAYESVEFTNVHSWALRYLRRNGVDVRVDPAKAARAWRIAFERVVTDGSPVHRAHLTSAYLRDEVQWIVRGRALPDVGSYLALERSGRGTPLPADLRIQVWWLAEQYSAELADQGITDFTEILLRAYEIAKDREPEYDAVLVDEAQDLTDAGLRLLHALVGDRRDGLLLVGDGQQSVYPGGVNLASLGIQVRGRSYVLTRNYRNTQEIYAAAQGIMTGRTFDDGEVRPEPGFRSVEVTRSGVAPMFHSAESEEDHDLALAEAIHTASGESRGLGDLAVLLPTNELANRYRRQITALGLSTQSLSDYDGVPIAAVKVGTYQRAKGLEFKHVFLPRIDPAGLREQRIGSEDPQTHAERIELLRRQLFVAMTRARDALWIGSVGTASSLLPTTTVRQSIGAQAAPASTTTGAGPTHFGPRRRDIPGR